MADVVGTTQAPATRASTDELVGREPELAVLERFLDGMSVGPDAVLAVGEAGIGKTTLWNETLRRASARGYRVLLARPAQPETKLAYSALGDLLGEHFDEATASLASPQREALEIALLRRQARGSHVDQRAVSVATLGALRSLAARRPLLAAIDDLQWADSPTARVLGYVIRRLANERIGVLATMRAEYDLSSVQQWLSSERFRRLEVGPLSLGAVRRLVRTHTAVTLARPALLRLYSASAGNPYYALEIARALEHGVAGEGGTHLPRVPESLSGLLRARLRDLPRSTRRALLVVAALAQPTHSTVADAIGDAGLAEHELERARLSGILAPEGLRFSHPLLAAICYADAPDSQRRSVHRRLAEVASDPEERARHLALATSDRSERVAAELEAAATRARARGAPDAAAELAGLALARTPLKEEHALQVRRLAMGEYLLDAGDTERARAALEESVRALTDHPARSRAVELLAALLYETDGPRAAADFCEQLAVESADDLAVQVVALTANDYDFDIPRAEASALRALELLSRLERPDLALLSRTWIMLAHARFDLGEGLDTTLLARALAVRGDRDFDHAHLSNRWLAYLLKYADDFERAQEGLERSYTEARAAGDEGSLPHVLGHLGELERWSGRWEPMERHAEEQLELAEDTGQAYQLCWALHSIAFVHALRGRLHDARSAAERALQLSRELDSPYTEGAAAWVLGFVHLSADALENAVAEYRTVERIRSAVGLGEPGRWRFQGDYIEALVGLGEIDEARSVAEALERTGRRLDRPWALAISARGRGLVLAGAGELEPALVALDEAIEEHRRLAMPFELGRTLLASGRVQRRAKRKRLARQSLERALEIFAGLGAPIWTEKARLELARIGLRPSAPHMLTETEERVARLAASGLTNREVAAAAFMSAKSVEANLSRAYGKLGIRSRAELGAWVARHDRVSLRADVGDHPIPARTRPD
jgi:DNA-binding CsgD family transcriptional regulator